MGEEGEGWGWGIHGRFGGSVFLQLGLALIWLLLFCFSRGGPGRGVAAEAAIFYKVSFVFLRLGRQDVYLARCSVGVPRGRNGAVA